MVPISPKNNLEADVQALYLACSHAFPELTFTPDRFASGDKRVGYRGSIDNDQVTIWGRDTPQGKELAIVNRDRPDRDPIILKILQEQLGWTSSDYSYRQQKRRGRSLSIIQAPYGYQREMSPKPK